MSGTSANPFSRMTILVLVLVGSMAFLGLLYGLGTGEFSQKDNNGKGHAVSNSLVGYTAFFDLMEKTGTDVSLGRSPAEFEKTNLLVITPSLYSDGEELAAIIEKRSYSGPTLIIMPKWFARKDPKLKSGWARLVTATPFDNMEESFGVSSEVTEKNIDPNAAQKENKNPSVLSSNIRTISKTPRALTVLEGKDIRPIVRDKKSGKPVIGYYDDGGYYPSLDGDTVREYSDEEYDEIDYERYPVVFVADPDLFNNMGMADKTNALHAIALVQAIDDGLDMPVVFDLTFNGLGSSENLLTLAFQPPFLAATICFLIAAVIIGWQNFIRFAPPILGGRSINFGKTALVRNSAAMLKLMSRQHLLREPYLAMVKRKAMRSLGIAPSSSGEQVTQQLDRASKPDKPPFSVLQNNLQRAKKPQDIVNAAVQIDIWKKDNL
ncbi:DUF4350 domain-containing protein [Parasphingorhabdus sp. DH2-15]|uniref:DUF4350 domain-containing protein n=1 Tax=Parasphingorhabdus sp. DH2-15 TaxID=3444112 RepID=UPI003F682E75